MAPLFLLLLLLSSTFSSRVVFLLLFMVRMEPAICLVSPLRLQSQKVAASNIVIRQRCWFRGRTATTATRRRIHHSSTVCAAKGPPLLPKRDLGDDDDDPFQGRRPQVESLLSRALSRAERTISHLEETTATAAAGENGVGGAGQLMRPSGRSASFPRSPPPPPPPSSLVSVSSLLSKAISRAERNLSTQTSSMEGDDDPKGGRPPSLLSEEELAAEVNENYGKNPAITTTALAHSLWSGIVRPNVDSAIDATCGNGGDASVIANMLFGDPDRPPRRRGSCQLLCVDISEQACENTRRELDALLPREVVERHVEVACRSHSPLPLPRDASSVGLVAYNLGYLPNLKDTSSTKTETTLLSMAGAVKVLRVGGMLSVITYPRSHREEDAVVRAFLHGLALFSSVTTDFETFVLGLDDKYFCCDPLVAAERAEYLRQMLLEALGSVLGKGGRKQTWRVYEHRKIGWTDAPILATATRIK